MINVDLDDPAARLMPFLALNEQMKAAENGEWEHVLSIISDSGVTRTTVVCASPVPLRA